MKLVLLSLCLAVAAKPAPLGTRPDQETRALPQAAAVVDDRTAVHVETVSVAVDDPWYQDQYGHHHGNDVELKRFVGSDGWTTVSVNGDHSASGVELTFRFKRQNDSKPLAELSGMWRQDRVPAGQASSGPLTDMNAFLLVSRNDWGKGWPMKCRFLVFGRAGATPVALSGAFVVEGE